MWIWAAGFEKDGTLPNRKCRFSSLLKEGLKGGLISVIPSADTFFPGRVLTLERL